MKTIDLSNLIDRLNKAMPNGVVCPMCHKHEFTTVDGIIATPIQQSLTTFSLGGSNIPCVAFVCNHCGFISQHAIGVLDSSLLVTSDKKDDKK